MKSSLWKAWSAILYWVAPTAFFGANIWQVAKHVGLATDVAEEIRLDIFALDSERPWHSH